MPGREKGFRLDAEDIYSINHTSMKDAVVRIGGCTGVVVSERGLVLTNHHCAYRAIQSHSTVENDYLTDGFWAMSEEEELPNPGLTGAPPSSIGKFGGDTDNWM